MSKVEEVNNIFNQYKRKCAKLLKEGRLQESFSIFSDSIVSSDEKLFNSIVESSRQATSSEELFINHVNFVFSLLNKQEKEVIINDFVLNQNSSWWLRKYSRATYYRIRNKTVEKFCYFYFSNDGN